MSSVSANGRPSTKLPSLNHKTRGSACHAAAASQSASVKGRRRTGPSPSATSCVRNLASTPTVSRPPWAGRHGFLRPGGDRASEDVASKSLPRPVLQAVGWRTRPLSSGYSAGVRRYRPGSGWVVVMRHHPSATPRAVGPLAVNQRVGASCGKIRGWLHRPMPPWQRSGWTSRERLSSVRAFSA